MLRQTKPRPWGRTQLSHGQQRQRASATERRRTVKRGFDATCCGRVKEGQGAAGADVALTWAAKAESERELTCERVCQGNNGAVAVSK